jgi:hypothetical protein
MAGYKHTQTGRVIIVSLLAGILIDFAVAYWAFATGALTAPSTAIVSFVVAVLCFSLLIFSTLTVSIDAACLRISFGPVYLIRRKWPLAEIASCAPVKNSWWYGWGIHLTPRGVLYNVSGLGAVEVRTTKGGMFRIGTDEPEQLAEAINAAKQNTPQA